MHESCYLMYHNQMAPSKCYLGADNLTAGWVNFSCSALRA